MITTCDYFKTLTGEGGKQIRRKVPLTGIERIRTPRTRDTAHLVDGDNKYKFYKVKNWVKKKIYWDVHGT